MQKKIFFGHFSDQKRPFLFYQLIRYVLCFYLFNKDKYWCRGVVVMERSGAIKVFADCDDKNTLSGQRVYIEDGDVLYTDKDEALQNSSNDEDSFREVKSDLENAYNNFKDNVQKAGDYSLDVYSNGEQLAANLIVTLKNAAFSTKNLF